MIGQIYAVFAVFYDSLGCELRLDAGGNMSTDELTQEDITKMGAPAVGGRTKDYSLC